MGHLALAGGGRGGAYGAEEIIPVMRGMMVVSPGATLDCREREMSLCRERKCRRGEREALVVGTSEHMQPHGEDAELEHVVSLSLKVRVPYTLCFAYRHILVLFNTN